MIRILLLTASFLTVTVILLMIQPRTPELTAADDIVARANFTPMAATSNQLGEMPNIDGPLLPGELRAFILRAVAEGRSDTYLEALLSQAAPHSRNDNVPTTLITPGGAINTIALVQALEVRDQGNTDIAHNPDKLGRSYTVASGDSLAAIARRFYGNVGAYDRIFRANRNILDKPNDIRAGQTLVLPGL